MSESITKQFDPELILFQAGVDGLATDALGKLNISRQGMSKRNEMVFDLAVEHLIPTVVFMGGGYSNPIHHTIDAFGDLFLSASRANNQILSKANLETPDSKIDWCKEINLNWFIDNSIVQITESAHTGVLSAITMVFNYM